MRVARWVGEEEEKSGRGKRAEGRVTIHAMRTRPFFFFFLMRNAE